MEDYQLIRAILKGDKDAFDTLVRKYYQDIYAYCCRRLGDSELAADLTQDIFLKMIQSLYAYRYRGKFRNFLFTIAVNTCSDYFRGLKPRCEDWDFSRLEDPAPLPEALLLEQEQAGAVRRWLDSLPDIQREALILYYFHGLKAREIAEILNLPLPTVKSRIRQGLVKMKKLAEREAEAHEI